MLFEIYKTNPNAKKVLVIDARSQMAAFGNKAKGGGFEQEQHYVNCKVEFWGIDNIHAVRDSYKKLFTLCESYHQTKDNKKILSKIESSGWLTLLKNILVSSARLAKAVTVAKQSVLIHCSDGWDRTAQLCSLSEMLIDPYYRTIKGFEVIIEKEWVTFGHKFESRWGHYKDDNYMPDERSPVFIQFLDWVHQLLKQFPTQFQFNVKLLLFIAHHVYTCKFGTFLGDNERTRFKEGIVKDKTTSIWTYINDNVYDFVNPFYEYSDEVINPNWDYVAIELWKEHFLSWSEFTQYKPDKALISAEEHKEELMKGVLEDNLVLQKRIKDLEDQLAFRYSENANLS